MNINFSEQPVKYSKAKYDKALFSANNNNFKTIAMVLGLLIFIGGTISVFLISRKQSTAPIAPTAPQSQPAAYVEKTQTCTIEFDVKTSDKIACGVKNCVENTDCETGLICITTSKTDDKNTAIKYCGKESYKTACVANPSVDSCCTAPEAALLSCGEKDCSTTNNCENGFVCISTSKTDANGKIIKYCADEDYLDECVNNPSKRNCCEAPVTATPTATVTPTTTATTTVTPTATPTNTVTTVITTVGCNSSCNANADCSNTSHICYKGQCRLDVNPTDSQCKLPSGETTIVRPAKVPTQSGPADWINYVKAGLGTLGVGALLLLLL